LNIRVAATKKLSITADDQIAELYVDGIATPVQPGGWQTVRIIDIPADTQVIAVKAVDIAKVGNIMHRWDGYLRLIHIKSDVG
jgi:hypothetical protein